VFWLCLSAVPRADPSCCPVERLLAVSWVRPSFLVRVPSAITIPGIHRVCLPQGTGVISEEACRATETAANAIWPGTRVFEKNTSLVVRLLHTCPLMSSPGCIVCVCLCDSCLSRRSHWTWA
jgi:hypothetical protein